MLMLIIDRLCFFLDFEAVNHRRPPLQAGSGRQKNHRREIFLRGAAIGAIAAALDYVYNRRALIQSFRAKERHDESFLSERHATTARMARWRPDGSRPPDAAGLRRIAPDCGPLHAQRA